MKEQLQWPLMETEKREGSERGKRLLAWGNWIFVGLAQSISESERFPESFASVSDV